MVDTFTQKFPRTHTAAYTIISPVSFHVKMPQRSNAIITVDRFFLANSAEPEEMPHLGHRCLPM